MRERLFRGDRSEHDRSRREVFDPIAEGRRYGLAPEVSATLWEQVHREATNSDGLCDESAARKRFAQLAELVAARSGQLGPAPFHWTQVDVELGRLPPDDMLVEPVPGKTTRVLAEASARAHVALRGVPGRTTLVAAQVASEVDPISEAQGFFRRYVSGGRAACARLEDALAARDHYAALVAVLALKEELRWARHLLANGLEHDENLTVELAALERPAEELLARLPIMSAGGQPYERWGPDSAEWRAATEQAGERAADEKELGGRLGGALFDSARVRIRLPAAQQGWLERAFGRRFDDVALHPDSSEVRTGQRAFTRGRHVHLERGVDPTSAVGEKVLAHELVHVAQQDGSGQRPGSRQELEREAARAATRAMRGQSTRIALRADASTAYAFSEDVGHEHEDRDESSDHDAATHDAGETEADVQAVSAVVPAEDAPAVAATVGGGPTAKRPKEPPAVAQAKPEQGLRQLQGVRPDKLGPVLGQMNTAASADVAQVRATQQANPPKRMSTGNGASTTTGKDGAPAAALSPTGGAAAPKRATPMGTHKDTAPIASTAVSVAALAAKDAAERPVKAEVPGGEADKKATQSTAAQQQKTASEVITQVANTIASWLGSWSSWLGHDHTQSTEAGKLSDQESRRMASSVDQIPTTTAGISSDTGPAPELAMQSEAKANADRERAALEGKIAAAEAQSRADSRAPLGEDHIETTAAPEELAAMPVAAGSTTAQPAAKLPTLASAPEEVGIIAQEQYGAEVDAALAKASADVSAERIRHTEHEAQLRAESDAQVRELKAKADTEQATARDAAQAEAGAARAQWQADIDKHGADARQKADKKVAEGMAQVDAEQAKANAEAKKHIEEGRQKAEQEKQKGEQEAAAAKGKAKHESKGFWGWVSSKAKAAFDSVKKAVSSVVDACRRAVKAVIEGAKKLAMAAIELARKAINATIKAIGHALIAIANVLLAAFPELKAKFQAAIREAVDKVTAAVNRVADRLKQDVQKALDRFGAALDQALQLLEKGIHAIIDAASAVVQGAIKAAQAIVEALGTWAKLIKDVATGPGAWLGKLGAAVVDGIKNHLWSAFKTTVVEWFKSKVFEMLGVGGIILELLLEGGLTKEHIIQMAMDALIVAIPAALIAILVEKLVSMIVPAAGAVMAIIEGLQAAWGTISRIIAAFSAFVGFLLAVKSGSAGPLFASLLAAAAVVVLDFVANWLLKKLASAARKVGAKLKSLAEKFKAKRKTKQDTKAGKHHDEQVGRKPHDHDEKKSPEERRKEEIQKRVEKAERELPSKIVSLISKRPSILRVRAQFAIWRLTYKLSRLEITKGGGGVGHIEAQVNPKINLGPAGNVYEFEWSEIAPIFHEVAAQYVGPATHEPDAPGMFRYHSRGQGTDASLEQQGKYKTGIHSDGSPAGFEVHEKETGRPPYLIGNVAEVRPLGGETGRLYPDIARDLQGVEGPALGRYLKAKMRGDVQLPPLGGREAVADELFGLWSFEPGHPRVKNQTPEGSPTEYRPTFGHKRDWTYSMMTVDLLEGGHVKPHDAILGHPAQGHRIQQGAKLVTAVDVHHTQREPTKGKVKEAYDSRAGKEIALAETWVRAKCTGSNAKLWETKPTAAQIKVWVVEQIKQFRGY